MNTVSFKDQEFEAPDWCAFVVSDPDGSVWAYAERPLKRSDGTWGSSDYGSSYEKIGWLDDPDCKRVG
jgi:hypothetical protein